MAQTRPVLQQAQAISTVKSGGNGLDLIAGADVRRLWESASLPRRLQFPQANPLYSPASAVHFGVDQNES
jgi:hypothetical protein